MPRRTRQHHQSEISEAERQRRAEQRRQSLAQYQPHPLRLYRTRRLAELFGVSRETVWRWRKHGILPRRS
jgi:hypothetical protein